MLGTLDGNHANQIGVLVLTYYSCYAKAYIALKHYEHEYLKIYECEQYNISIIHVYIVLTNTGTKNISLGQ